MQPLNYNSAVASVPGDPAGDTAIRDAYGHYLTQKDFPCVAAKAAVGRDNLRLFVADHLACPKDDAAILRFLYSFVDDIRAPANGFHSATVLFRDQLPLSEKMFDVFLWQRLQALADLDAAHYDPDPRVDADPASPKFSFSIKSEAFYVIGLHAGSSREARRFAYPAMVFNPHAQFEQLRASNRYLAIRQTIRKRDLIYSGSVNPMLTDFGEASEVFQYSGRSYDADWQCPLKSTHARTPGHSTP